MIEQKHFWSVGSKIFYIKNDALRELSLTKNKILFHVGNDDCWKNQKINDLTISLDNLYLSRALHLRQKYKKLRLFFSGGSDSLNILQTFVKNNIPLDELIVRWSHKAIDGNFYSPNIKDKSAKNSLSEWNYAIKPVLDHISSHHPHIKIIIENNTRECLENPDAFSIDNFLTLFEKFTPIRGTLGSMIQRMGLDDECKLGESFHSTANIFGIEKPLLFYKDNNYYFSFCDLPFEVTTGHNSGVAEAFYWTPDMPEIVNEQVKTLINFYETTPNLKSFLLTEQYHPDNQEKIHMQNIIGKSVIYSGWDINTFQVNKPNFYRNDWWGWIEDRVAVDRFILNKNFNQASEIYYEKISSKYFRKDLSVNEKTNPLLPHAVFSNLFLVSK